MAKVPTTGAEEQSFILRHVAGRPATSVPVAFARIGDENLVSRSQARKILARLDRFEDVVLDFRGVESIGQAFADEIFRVFATEHPTVKFKAEGTTPAVDRMIRRALAHAADDRETPKPTG